MRLGTQAGIVLSRVPAERHLANFSLWNRQET